MKPKLYSKGLVPIGTHTKTPKLSIFAFPPAGSGALFFSRWSSLLPDGINLWAIRLPGRETRLHEPFLTTWPELIESLLQALESNCHPPFVFLGHSLGALIGFELAHQFQRVWGYRPDALVVSGREPPHFPNRNRDYRRSDLALLEELKADGGTPEAVLNNSELMDLYLPIYRADLQLNQNYQYRPQEQLSCPILALGGENDSAVRVDALREWSQYTNGPFQLKLFLGGHMYLTQQQQRIDMIRQLLEFLTSRGLSS